MAGVPFIFGNATTSIPLTNLDANFNTGLTIGNTTVGLGNTVTTLGNVTLNNVTVSGATGITQIVNGTSNVVIASSGGNINVGVAGANVAFFTNAGIIITGTNTNNSATTGQVGEYIEANSGYFTNTTTVANATSISLTAGDWDVFAALSSGGASSICSGASLGINTTSATLGTQSIDFINFAADGVNGNCGSSFSKRISLSATTTVYGITRVTAGTATYTSVQLSARRRR